MASEIVGELKPADPDRDVETEIDAGLLAEAGSRSRAQRLQNPIANGLTFTSHRARARVWFGAVEDGGVPM